jgi:cytochrome c-type biogenesis protein CcmH/NrfF
MIRTVSYAAMLVALVAALAVGVLDDTGTRTPEDRVNALAASIRCPQCRSQSAGDSDAPTAQAVRREIAERVEAGQSDAEIRSYFASTYGEEILLRPPASGVGALVWVVPVAAFVLAAGGLAYAFARWKRWS